MRGRVHGPVRGTLKRLLAGAVAAVTPQCRYARTVFVLGHMRCGSTALSRVLCAHPEISGFGEAHVPYRSGAALGQLLLGQWRRGAWKRSAHYLHDKILHTRYDGAPPPQFTEARAIFLLRPPEPAIRSIRHLFRAIDSREYATDALAADYYAERLHQLARLWRAFPAQRRIAIGFTELTTDPDRALARLTRFLSLATPLANAYAPGGSGGHGVGDPLTSPGYSAIVPRAQASRSASPLALPAHRITELQRLHAEVCTLFSQSALLPAGQDSPSPVSLLPEYSTPPPVMSEIS